MCQSSEQILWSQWFAKSHICESATCSCTEGVKEITEVNKRCSQRHTADRFWTLLGGGRMRKIHMELWASLGVLMVDVLVPESQEDR